MSVFKEFYEVVGAADKKRARAHFEAKKSAWGKQWDLIKSLGAEGFRPGYGGRIRSLLFKKGKVVPKGLRKVGVDQGRDEYEPSRNTKAGKNIAALLAEAPRVYDWGVFADTFGWKGRSPLDGDGHGRTLIYHCSGVHVTKPRERFFLTYPRELKDGWKPPKGIKLVRESDVIRAVEDHMRLSGKRGSGKRSSA